MQWNKISEVGLPKEDGCYLIVKNSITIPIHYTYDLVDFSLNLYKVDKYDFYPKKEYNRPGFFKYDDGFFEIDDIIAWGKFDEYEE